MVSMFTIFLYSEVIGIPLAIFQRSAAMQNNPHRHYIF